MQSEDDDATMEDEIADVDPPTMEANDLEIKRTVQGEVDIRVATTTSQRYCTKTIPASAPKRGLRPNGSTTKHGGHDSTTKHDGGNQDVRTVDVTDEPSSTTNQVQSTSVFRSKL
jgi:hypothetical protein